MHVGVPEPGDGVDMRTGRVSLVAVEAIAWVDVVQPHHLAVTDHLRHDRSGSDRRATPVTADHGTLRQVEAGHAKAVDESECRLRLERQDRAAEGIERCAVHVEPIDIARRRRGYRPALNIHSL